MWCSSGAEISKDCAGGEISGAIDDGDPVLGRGKADPLELAVELGQEVGPGEGGPALGHGPHGHAGRVVEDLVGQVAVVEEGKIISARQLGHPRALLGADVALRPVPPLPGQLVQAPVFFGRAGLECRLLAQLEDGDVARLVAVRAGVRGDQFVLSDLDGGRSAGELGHQSLGYPGHLVAELVGVTATPTVPAPPQRLGQKVAEHPLVELGKGDHVLEQGPAVEGPPPAVGDRSGPIRHHHVVMELGIPGPRIPVGERGGHDALDVLLDHPAGPRTRAEHLFLGVGEHHLDGPAVAVIDHGFGVGIGQRPGGRY